MLCWAKLPACISTSMHTLLACIPCMHAPACTSPTCTPRRPSPLPDSTCLTTCRLQLDSSLSEAAASHEQQLKQLKQQQEAELASVQTQALQAHQQHQQQLAEAARASDQRLQEETARLRASQEGQMDRLKQQLAAVQKAHQVCQAELLAVAVVVSVAVRVGMLLQADIYASAGRYICFCRQIYMLLQADVCARRLRKPQRTTVLLRMSPPAQRVQRLDDLHRNACTIEAAATVDNMCYVLMRAA